MAVHSLRKSDIAFRLKSHAEYMQASFAALASAGLAIVLLTSAYSGDVFHPLLAYIGFAYCGFTFLQAFIWYRIRQDLITSGSISKYVRLLGYPMMLSFVTGNLVAAAAAFHLVKQKKHTAYTLSVYALLSTLLVIAVTALNLLKPYVANGFIPGASLLLIAAGLQLISLLLSSRLDEGRLQPYLTWTLIILHFIAAVSGNLFSLFTGTLLLAKLRNKSLSAGSRFSEVLERISHNMAAMLGLLFVSVLLSLSITSVLTFDYSLAIDNNYSAILQAPSAQYPLGTDNFGRDLYTRIVLGARISLFVGFLSTAIPLVIGGLLGALSGYYGKRLDNGIMRALDILYAIPGILLAIAIIAAFGAGTMNLILALSVGSIPSYARTMRANVLQVSTLEYVQAARAFGSSDWVILARHILPNAAAPMIVQCTLTIGTAVISTSSLSFLGLGVEPHIPEWGNILKLGSAYLETHSFTAIYPGLAIILLVLSFNFLGDGLRDALDPKISRN